MPPHPPRPETSSLSADVHVRVTPQQYDQVYDRARKEGVSIPEIVRRGLQRELDDKK